jgi:hypothetical protein
MSQPTDLRHGRQALPLLLVVPSLPTMGTLANPQLVPTGLWLVDVLSLRVIQATRRANRAPALRRVDEKLERVRRELA